MKRSMNYYKVMLVMLVALQALFFDSSDILPISKSKEESKIAKEYDYVFTVELPPVVVADVEPESEPETLACVETEIITNELEVVCVSPHLKQDLVCMAPEYVTVMSVGDFEVLSIDPNSSTKYNEDCPTTTNIDPNYKGQVVSVTGANRQLLEALVFGEAGGEGFYGQALVAQAIRDTMLMDDISSISKIISKYKYSGRTDLGTSDSVKDAVSFIFDEGNYVVQHRIIYFYAPKYCSSSFHESQEFVLQHKGHRFFDDITK